MLASTSLAEPVVWTFDKVHSNFYFEIKHVFSSVRGRFQDFSGTFLFDPNQPEKGRLAFEVRTKSVDTDIAKRDEHLRTKDFFHAERYPTMRFESTSISHLLGNRYEVKGRLRIKDVTQEVTIPFIFFGVRENPMQEGQMVAGFESRFSLDRLEYHVGDGKYYRMGVTGKTVDVTVTLEMLRDK
jgi:polyisoprenoid-binding protein YceI